MIALPNGDLCVADRLYSRLQVLSRDGEQKHTIGSYGRSTGQMVSCKGMACDGEFLYVSDYAKSRVQKLRLHDGALVASVGNYGTAAGPKCSLGSAFSSAPAPLQGTPGTPRKKPCHWAPSHRLGCSSSPPPTPPMRPFDPPPLTA